jgi:hypothetical protein
MLWAAASVVLLIVVLVAILLSRRRFAPADVVRASFLASAVLAPIALVGGALSLLPNATFGTYLVVLPFAVAYVFWLDLTFGVSARLVRIGPRSRRPAPPDDAGAES